MNNLLALKKTLRKLTVLTLICSIDLQHLFQLTDAMLLISL